MDTAAEQRLQDLVLLRRVRDRIDREYAQPLDVAALARGVHMSANSGAGFGRSPQSPAIALPGGGGNLDM